MNTNVQLNNLIDAMVAQYRNAITPVVELQIGALTEQALETQDISEKVFLVKPMLLTQASEDGSSDTTAVILTGKRVNVATCYMMYYERKDVYDEKMRSPFMLRFLTVSVTHELTQQMPIELSEVFEAEIQRQLRMVFGESIASVKRSGMMYASILPIKRDPAEEARLQQTHQEDDHHA
jgi:hypothetical protein